MSGIIPKASDAQAVRNSLVWVWWKLNSKRYVQCSWPASSKENPRFTSFIHINHLIDVMCVISVTNSTETKKACLLTDSHRHHDDPAGQSKNVNEHIQLIDLLIST